MMIVERIIKMNDYEEIEKILIDLTNALNYDNQNENHKDAYITAYDDLCRLVDAIIDREDNAERL